MGFGLGDMQGADVRIIEEGWQRAVCCGLLDIGEQKNRWDSEKKTVSQVVLVFRFVDYDNADIVEIFTKSIHPKSKLRKTLIDWRGRDFTMEELKAFSLDKLVNAPLLAEIEHKTDLSGSLKPKIKAIKTYSLDEPIEKLAEVYVFDINNKSTYGAFVYAPKWLQRKINEAKEFEDANIYLNEQGITGDREAGLKNEPHMFDVVPEEQDEPSLVVNSSNDSENIEYTPDNLPF